MVGLGRFMQCGRVIACRIIVCLAASAAAAQAAPDSRAYPTLGASGLDFRHFAGHRYVTVAVTRVQRERRSTSPIIADIPRLYMVYAEPTDDTGWLAVRGAGATAYPDFDEAASFVELADGRLVLPEIEDSGPYVSLVGFIPRSAVVDLDATADAPPAIGGLRPVPALWEKLGLPEPRSFGTLAGTPPFDGIGRLSSRSGYCTAFFVARDVVVTAGHCIPDTPPYSLVVTVERGADQRDAVPGSLVDARRLTDQRAPGDDWAVVNLRRPPRMPITPLHFHRGDAFVGHASVPVTMVGYPADLRAVSKQLLGFNAPVVSGCIALLPEAWVTVSGDSERSALRLHAPCITFPGESGGPLLVWSKARARYEVVGITSTYRDHDAITPVFSPTTSATVRSFASGLATEYGVPPLDAALGFSVRLREDTPGAALLSGLLPTFGAGQPWANFPLSASLALAVGRATGHVPKMPIATLFQPGSAVRVSDSRPARPPGATDLAAIRALCALRCTDRQLDPALQDRATIGTHLAASVDDLPDLALPGSRRWRVAGGDLFVVDPATATVGHVVRDVMHLAPAGGDADWDRALACRCDQPVRPVDLPGMEPSAPEALAGVTVLAPRELDRRRRSAASGIVTLSADAAALRIPGALNASFAAGPVAEDAAQSRLGALIDSRTGGDRQSPVALYGRQNAARSGFNLASRVLRLGYRHVIWMREGLSGWAADGLELSANRTDRTVRNATETAWH